MSHMKGIIEEEKERLEELITFYKNKIMEFPKGTIRKKKISGNDYAYLRYREDGRHYTKYISKVDSDEVKNIEEQIIERKRLEKLLKQAKSNYNEIVKLSKVVKDEG